VRSRYVIGVLQPLRDLIQVTRLEGHGIETVSAGGIILPATREANVRTKGDYFRARVDAMGPEAIKAYAGDLKPGDEVLIYTYSGTAESVFTGEKAGDRLFVRPDDILAAVAPERPALLADLWRDEVAEVQEELHAKNHPYWMTKETP
jgi:co-chaperonin GroES (HSP10)